MTITIVTHTAMAGGSPEDHMLAAALSQEHAVAARFAVWDDPATDWGATAITVIRSTWDYHLKPATWHDWLDHASRRTRLVNDVGIIRWNSDKSYLLDLAAAGVSIVPTLVLDDPGSLTVQCAERGWHDVVIKPIVGAGASGAKRFAGDAIASRGVGHAATLLATGKALVQPYQAAVETERERSLVFVAGRFTHAFTKPPFLAGLGGEHLALHRATAAELSLAGQALRASPGIPLVARVDMLPSTSGPVLMDLELIEPQLGLGLAPWATSLLADELAKIVRQAPD